MFQYSMFTTTYQIVYNSSKMYWILSAIITTLLYQLIWKEKEGRVRQSISLQAKKVNIVLVKNDHHRISSGTNKMEESAIQQPPAQREDNTDQQTNINNDMRIIRLLMRQQSINRIRDREYEELCNGNDTGRDEVDSPRYKDFIKSEIDSSDENDEW